jgi:leucyl/phenylalanyl-tRNA---protein transferase
MLLTTAHLLKAYAQGVFPMAPRANSTDIEWFKPEQRCLFLPHAVHIPTRLRRWLRQQARLNLFELRWNTDFLSVITACANRTETWINNNIIAAYTQLHHAGAAHSIEVYQQDILVGGLYGVQMGHVFMAESMFSTTPNASKLALSILLAQCWHNGIAAIDVQFNNPHLAQFKPHIWPHSHYQKLLDHNIYKVAPDLGFVSSDVGFAGLVSFLQSITHTS